MKRPKLPRPSEIRAGVTRTLDRLDDGLATVERTGSRLRPQWARHRFFPPRGGADPTWLGLATHRVHSALADSGEEVREVWRRQAEYVVLPVVVSLIFAGAVLVATHPLPVALWASLLTGPVVAAATSFRRRRGWLVWSALRLLAVVVALQLFAGVWLRPAVVVLFLFLALYSYAAWALNIMVAGRWAVWRFRGVFVDQSNGLPYAKIDTYPMDRDAWERASGSGSVTLDGAAGMDTLMHDFGPVSKPNRVRSRLVRYGFDAARSGPPAPSTD